MASGVTAKLEGANLKVSAIGNPPARKIGKLLLLGSGGYGEVWKFGTTNGDVARKFFEAQALHQAEYEVVQSCWAFSNSAVPNNVIKSFGSGMDEDAPVGERYWIDYELAHMGDLRHELRRKMVHFPTAAATRDLVLDCLAGINFLHQKVAMTHNDIKPENILIFPGRSSCICKIADLGCASQIPANGAVYKVHIATWGYTAPEVFNYKREVIASAPRTTGKLDVYGLGAALCEVLDGRPVTQYPAVMAKALTLYEHERLKPNRQRQAALAWIGTCNAAKEFFYNKFFAPIPSGTNVNNVYREVCIAVGLMCYASPQLRPDAEECIQLIRSAATAAARNVVTDAGTSPMAAALAVCGGNSPMTAQLIEIASVGNSAMTPQAEANVAVSAMAAQVIAIAGGSPGRIPATNDKADSCTKPKRKQNLPPPADIIVIEDTPPARSTANATTQLQAPPPPKKPHMQPVVAAVSIRERVRANLLQRAEAAQRAPALSKHTLARLVEAIHTDVTMRTTKATCQSVFADVLDRLRASETEKCLGINAAGRELFEVLMADTHYSSIQKVFYFNLLTNRGESCWRSLKAQHKMAAAKKH
jgi:serine/threonine protein kinase